MVPAMCVSIPSQIRDSMAMSSCPAKLLRQLPLLASSGLQSRNCMRPVDDGPGRPKRCKPPGPKHVPSRPTIRSSLAFRPPVLSTPGRAAKPLRQYIGGISPESDRLVLLTSSIGTPTRTTSLLLCLPFLLRAAPRRPTLLFTLLSPALRHSFESLLWHQKSGAGPFDLS